MTNVLKDKVALVTGASSGMGLATAKAFVEAGAFVFATARGKTKLDAAFAGLADSVVTIEADASNMEDLDTVFRIIGERIGRLDIIFANAGGGPIGSLAMATEAQYRQTFDLIVKSTVFTVQKALPLLTDGASIILNSSTTTGRGAPGFSLYAGAKAAVRHFARSWAVELRDRRIRVNVITPGPIETPGMRDVLGDHADAAIKSMPEKIPAGRMGRGEDIAGAALFLASDAAAFINGAELVVDGGISQI
ncbi:MAG: SDR family NAD(P)-dependent oxidoreductase [Janthinobacterium lividum]